MTHRPAPGQVAKLAGSAQAGLRDGLQVLQEMKASGVTPTAAVFNALMDVTAKVRPPLPASPLLPLPSCSPFGPSVHPCGSPPPLPTVPPTRPLPYLLVTARCHQGSEHAENAHRSVGRDVSS